MREIQETNDKIVVPSEGYYGAKFRLAPDILARAPIKTGGKFIDLCAGRGALTFRAWAIGFKFEEWYLNDINTARWFEAVRDIGHEIKVPSRSRAEFEKQKALAEKGDQRAIALAPWLCFNGGDYSSGGSHGQDGGGRRTPESEERNLRLMHEVLTKLKPQISSDDWRVCLERLKPGPRDLIVIDFPYLDCKTEAYDPENVLPIEGIDWLQENPECNWIFCEYDQPIYRYAFGAPIFQKEVQLRTVNFAKTKQGRRMECVWTSERYKAHLANSGAKGQEALHATLRDPKEYPNLTIEKVLEEIRAVVGKIEGHRLRISAEERKRLLPLLTILRKLTKRKKPGFHKLLDSIGLNASTVRSWFYRGVPTDQIIEMLEPEPEPDSGGNPAPTEPAVVVEPDINVIAAELVRDIESGARKEKLKAVVRDRNRLNPTVRKNLIAALSNAGRDAASFKAQLSKDFRKNKPMETISVTVTGSKKVS